MRDKAVVLLSGGLDSSYNLFRAVNEMDVALALTFDYGQKAACREIETAKRLTDHLKIKHQVIELPWFKLFTKTSLVGDGAPPSGRQVSIDDFTVSTKTAEKVWVPNRNGILLNIAAGFAEGVGAQWVIPGFNLEEATTFPDNSQDYMRALDSSLSFSTANKVKTKCFSVNMNKTEIVADSLKLEVPLKELWPCYLAGESWCGECESCQRFQRAVKANGVKL